MDDSDDFATQMRQMQLLAGDFYNDPVEVRRGVTLGSLSELVSDSTWKEDFYGQEGNPFGLSEGYPSNSFDCGKLSGFGVDPCGDGSSSIELISEQLPLELGLESIPKGHIGASDPVDIFTRVHRPPPLPNDLFFQLAVSTFHVSTVQAFQTMNKLVHFLHTQVTSAATKINVHKCTIKADIFVDSLMCTIKIRSYREEDQHVRLTRGKYTYPYENSQGNGSYSYADPYADDHCARYEEDEICSEMLCLAVEFQRRSGDCLAFNTVYQLALAYFQPSIASVSEAPGITKVCAHYVSTANDEDDGDLSPLLDMIGASDMPESQAEAVSVLAEKATDGKHAARLCAESAFTSLKQLLHNHWVGIAYPTARLLCALAEQPCAAQCFSDKDLLVTMLEHATSNMNSSLVKDKMAEALNMAVTSFGSLFPDELIEDLGKLLSHALAWNVDAHTWSVSFTLQKAQAALQVRNLQTNSSDVQCPTMGHASASELLAYSGTSREQGRFTRSEQNNNFDMLLSGPAGDTAQHLDPRWRPPPF